MNFQKRGCMILCKDIIPDSGITINRKILYLNVLERFNVTGTKTILFPSDEGKASWVLREESAEATAQVMITEGHKNKTYTLTNTESVGFKSIAENISEALGEKIEYKSPNVKRINIYG